MSTGEEWHKAHDSETGLEYNKSEMRKEMDFMVAQAENVRFLSYIYPTTEYRFGSYGGKY